MALLDGALDYSVTLICAPVGYGKTIAVGQWLSRRKIDAVLIDCTRLGDADMHGLLDGCGDGNRVFVFENAQAVVGNGALQDTLRQFLQRAPEGSHSVVVSRCVPRIGLSKFRLDGDLLEIDESALAFTELETRDLLLRSGLDLSDGELREALERTEGWPAALRLSCASAQGAAGIDSVGCRGGCLVRLPR